MKFLSGYIVGLITVPWLAYAMNPGMFLTYVDYLSRMILLKLKLFLGV